MAIITARAFNHDAGAAKREALHEPVIITDRGEPSFVLMTYAEYQRLTGRVGNIVDLLRQDLEGDFDHEFPTADIQSRQLDS